MTLVASWFTYPILPAGPIGGAEQGLFANLHANVQINGSLGLIAERLQLKRMVPVAVDRAIVEIITPVVERSVTIACMTTQELIVKVSHALTIFLGCHCATGLSSNSGATCHPGTAF